MAFIFISCLCIVCVCVYCVCMCGFYACVCCVCMCDTHKGQRILANCSVTLYLISSIQDLSLKHGLGWGQFSCFLCQQPWDYRPVCSHARLFCLSAVDELQNSWLHRKHPSKSVPQPSYNFSRCIPRLLVFSIGDNQSNYTRWLTSRKPLSCFSLPSFMLFVFYLLSVVDYVVACVHWKMYPYKPWSTAWC